MLPAAPEFDHRPPRRSAVEPNNVTLAQLADIVERSLALYLSFAERTASGDATAEREMRFHSFVVSNSLALLRVNLAELSHYRDGELDDALRCRLSALLSERVLGPLRAGNSVLSERLAVFAAEALETLLLGFVRLYPSAEEQIAATAQVLDGAAAGLA